MPRTCTICSNDQKLAIDAQIAVGKSYRGIARQFSVSDDAITRHVKSCIPQALEAARQQEKAKSGLVVEDEVQKVFRRLNKLIDACDEWLTDPDDPEKYTLEPRDNELQVIYLDPTDRDQDGNPKRKRDSLRGLLERIEGEQFEALKIESKHADPRELVVKTAAQIGGQLELYARLLGLFQKPRDNDKDVERREREAEENRRWANSLIKQVQKEKRLSEDKAKDWVMKNVPTASEWLQ